MPSPDAPPPGPMEPEFASLLIPLMWMELAEETALAAGAAWREGATVFADIGRAQALAMTDSFERMMSLAAGAAQSILAPPAH